MRNITPMIALAGIYLLAPAAMAGERAGERADTYLGPLHSPQPPESMRIEADVLRPALAGSTAPVDPRDGVRDEELDQRRRERAAGELRKAPSPKIGGDDIHVRGLDYLDNVQVDVASNGDIYMAVALGYSDFDEYIEIYRSLNGGDTFSLVGTLNTAGDSDERLYDIDIFEGAQNRVFVTYMYYDAGAGGFDMRVAWADLTAGALTWNVRTVMNEPGVSFLGPDLTADAAAFSAYYMYAVCAGLDSNGDDIWFARSTDYGNTWSAPYRIASLTASSNLMYSRPYVAYGQGGFVHVAWTYTERLQSTFDDAVLYRRGANYGDTPADWTGTLWALYPSSDGSDQATRSLVASVTTANLAVFASDWINAANPRVFANVNQGASWTLANEDPLVLDLGVDAQLDETNARVVAFGRMNPAGEAGEMVLIEAPLSNLLDWSAPENFAESVGYAISSPSITLDASRGQRVAVAWQGTGTVDYQAAFDAEWRADPGYPNYEDGYPLAIPTGAGLSTQHRTAPALVNVDADPELEIVFADVDGRIYVVDSAGVQSGWPRDIGQINFRAPVAVGDLDGNGTMEIVAGNTAGEVHAFDAAGNLLPGFPVSLGTGSSTFVSIGAAGPPYARWIIAASGNLIARVNYRGVRELKSGTLNGVYMSPAAIGDLEGDGDTEVVIHTDINAAGSGVHVFNADWSGGTIAFRGFAEEPNDAVTLADLDINGDLEICHPTASGKLYVLHHNLTDLAGFPFDNGTAVPITSVALDQILGTAQPELLFASQDARVHVVYSTGLQQTGFPAATSAGWWLFGAPVVTAVLGGNPWAVVGSRDSRGHAFRNVGATQPAGWPRLLDDQVEVSPAAGDLDLDGRNEIVFLGNAALHVVDVGTAPGSAGHESWPMWGSDHERTGCMDCLEDLATPAPELEDTRVSLRMLSQNPARGQAALQVVLPSPGVLALEVIDLRGRRVRLVTRQERVAGTHVFHFDGRDDRGVRVANGAYLARLTVRGAQLAETRVQRFIWLE